MNPLRGCLKECNGSGVVSGGAGSEGWTGRNERVYYLSNCVSINYGLVMSSKALGGREGAGEKGVKVIM